MEMLIFDKDADFYARELSARAPDVKFTAVTTIEAAIAEGRDAEVLIALAPRIQPDLIAAMPKLKWVQALTTGVDNLASFTGFTLTNCHGIHGPQMTELAVMLMLASSRRFSRMQVNQRLAVWDRWPQPLLSGKTACIVGVGSIAEYLASVLNAFGMTVSGVTSRDAVDGFSRLYHRTQIHDAVRDADFVIVLTPYTNATHHIIDEGVIGAMQPHAHLINISRGGCVDEAALLNALIAGDIAGAALDVFSVEPLPKDSPLWSAPNLIVTPHLGGLSDVYHEQALPIVAANVEAYCKGGVAALQGVVR